MLELDKVLVVIDPDRETQLALDKALTLEKLSEFEIKPIACDYSKHLVEGYCFDAVQIPQLMEDYLAERKTALEALTETLPAQGSSVLADASWGPPAA